MASSLASTLVGTSDPGWELTVIRTDDGPARDAGLAGLGEPELVAACLAGRPGAFDVVVERHRRTVYQLCYRFVGNHEDASDLTQDVFLRAFRGLRNFKGQSSLGTWLYRIGVNVCLNRVSVKTPVNEPIEKHQHVDDGSESPSDRLLRGERALQVRAAITRLPRKQRAALILRMYHEMSHQEIAQTLGSSVGAVKANVFHALQNLKKLLAEGVS
jgi:RNA polymerase sigma-70 factor (ECF subfamily)